MYGKAILFVTLVVLGVVLPYVLADGNWRDRLDGLWSGKQASNADAEPFLLPQLDDPSADPTMGSGAGMLPPGQSTFPTADPTTVARSRQSLPSVPAIAGPVGTPLENLLSFGVTPDWVSENWSRVSTRTAELDLDGWRVALLTGNTDDDLTGSITYYFDRQQRMQRIVLHGYTANPARIIQLAQSRFSMRRIPRVGANVYVAVIEDESIGALLVRHPLIMRDEARRVEILMELNRVGTVYGMSLEFTEILKVAEQRESADRTESS